MSNYPTTNGYWVYGHRTPRHQWYIGMSQQQPKDRWKPSNYKGMSLEPYIEEYGWDNLEHRVFIDGLNKTQAELIEDIFITRLRTEGLCMNKQRSGGRRRDNTEEYKQEHNKQKKQYYETNKERIIERQKQYRNQVSSTPEYKIYNRVKTFNRRHPDKAIETPMEAKQKYLQTEYIPDYIKNDDLQ